VTTAELIKRLSAEVTPVRQLPRLGVRLGWWAITALAVAAAGVMIIGARLDLPEAAGRPTFLLATGLLALTATSAALGALALSIPGVERPWPHRALPLAAVMAWPAVIIGSGSGTGWADASGFALHGACPPIILGLAVVPAWRLVRMLRAGAPLHPAWTAALAVLAAGATAAVALQAICPFDAPDHQLVEHVLPVALLTAAGAAAGRSILTPANGQTAASRPSKRTPTPL
jgi:hypothetical protein